MGTDTYLIASSLRASNSIEVTQDNECVASRTLPSYGVEFGVEYLLLFKFRPLGRSIYCYERYEAQSVLQSHQHYTLINRSNLNDRRLQSTGNAYSYTPEVSTIATAGPVVSITPTTDLSAARPPHLGEPHYIHFQPPEFI